MQMITLEHPREHLATLADPGEAWLCCHKCDRFFQYKNGVDDDEVRCPQPDCHGIGMGFNIFLWDGMRVHDDPRWPKSSSELAYGQRAPDPEPFYFEQLRLRSEKLSVDFDGSSENHEIGALPNRFLRPFFKMMSDLSCDVTTPSECEFSRELAYAVEDLPVWSRTTGHEAAEQMRDELVAFFRFASRTDAVPDAQEWLAFLTDIDLVERLEYTMQNDPRLQPENLSGSPDKCRARNARKRNQKKRKGRKSRKCHRNG